MSSFTITESQTFTITDAKQMASKVATDLMRIARFYPGISEQDINNYERELTLLLKEGYLNQVTYGFQKENKWYDPTVKYTAKELIDGSGLNDDPGKIRPNCDVSGTFFTSFLTYSEKWTRLSDEEKVAFKNTLPFRRSSGIEPGVNGYFIQDRIYSSGGRSLNRESVRSF